MSNKKSKLFIFFLSLTIMMGAFGITSIEVEASSGTYYVKKIQADGTLAIVGSSFANFDAAKKAMNKQKGNDIVVTFNDNKSPLKIVAMKTGYAQSYPYRKGSGFGESSPSETLNIYSNQNGSATKTYIAAHYKMFYHETFEKDDRLIAEVTIQGSRGFVDINKIDMIPMFFVNNAKKITLGGNENYYETIGKPKEKSNETIIKHDRYTVTNNNGLNEISAIYSRAHSAFGEDTTTYGQAPSWLKAGVNYYSRDGIRFYTDPEQTKSVNNGSEFYAYYQWLPLRTMSNLTSKDLHDRMKYMSDEGSIIFDHEHAFIENGYKYGMNSLLLFAQAAHESAWGKSHLALDRYNLFGWGAFDSNPGAAKDYSGVFSSVKSQMSSQLKHYLDHTDWRNEGQSFGNKGAGIGVRYASDPFYGIKVAGIAYQTDRSLGFIDHNAYDLAKLDTSDGSGFPLRKEAKDSSSLWSSRTTRGSIQTDIRTNLGTANGYIKSNVPLPTKNGSITYDPKSLDLTKEFTYFKESFTDKITNHGTKKAKIPTNRIVVADEVSTTTFETTDALNQRVGWSTDTKVIALIPEGTRLSGHKVTNGWVKLLYKGQTGFVHGDYLEEVTNKPVVPPVDKPVTPPVDKPVNPPVDKPDNSTVKGDIDGKNGVTMWDSILIYKHVVGTSTLKGEELKRADIDGENGVTMWDSILVYKHVVGTDKFR